MHIIYNHYYADDDFYKLTKMLWKDQSNNSTVINISNDVVEAFIFVINLI